ncbi:hypothetical protein PTKIN_Ptkin08bG0020800 [Pterospermum kingtungense]
MEVKNMRVVVQTIMLLLIIELVVAQPGVINTPQIPQTPPVNTPLIPQTPPANTPLIPQTPPAAGAVMPPPDAMVTNPPGAVILPPTMPLPGDGMLPPILPGDDGLGLVAPFIPYFGSLSLPKKKCLGQCNLQCRRTRRNKVFAKFCVTSCLPKCGLRLSDAVFSCTNNCALSVSPNLISDAGEADKVVNACYEQCKNN